MQLDFGIHPNNELQADWKELGSENFRYEIIEEIRQTEDKPLDYGKEVKALEEMIIEELQPFANNGYNKR